MNTVQVSSSGPTNSTIITNPKIAALRGLSPLNRPFLDSRPVTNPSNPKENICHGVHGSLTEKHIADNQAEGPVINPACGPKAMAVIMMIPPMGLKFGAHTIRPLKHGDGAHHCEGYKFTGIRLSSLKTYKKRYHGIYHDEHACHVIFSVSQVP